MNWTNFWKGKTEWDMTVGVTIGILGSATLLFVFYIFIDAAISHIIRIKDWNFTKKRNKADVISSFFDVPGLIAAPIFLLLLFQGSFFDTNFTDAVTTKDWSQPSSNVLLYWTMIYAMAVTLSFLILESIIDWFHRREDGVKTFNISSYDVKYYLGKSKEQVLKELLANPDIFKRSRYQNQQAKNFNGETTGWKHKAAFDGERAEKYFLASNREKKLIAEKNLSNDYINGRCDFIDSEKIYEIKSTFKKKPQIDIAFNNMFKYQLLTYLFLAEKTNGLVVVYSRGDRMRQVASYKVVLTKDYEQQFKEMITNIQYARDEIINNRMWKIRRV